MRSLFALAFPLHLVQNPGMGEGQDSLERAIVGGLKSAIRDHGPITADKITSAAKRIAGNLKNARLDGMAAALGRKGGLSSKQAGANFAKLGRRGGRAGKGSKKPRSDEARRRMLARRLLRAAGPRGELDAAAMVRLAPDRPQLHVATTLPAAAQALGVAGELQDLQTSAADRG